MYHNKTENRQNNFLAVKALDRWRKYVGKMYFHGKQGQSSNLSII